MVANDVNQHPSSGWKNVVQWHSVSGVSPMQGGTLAYNCDTAGLIHWFYSSLSQCPPSLRCTLLIHLTTNYFSFIYSGWFCCITSPFTVWHISTLNISGTILCSFSFHYSLCSLIVSLDSISTHHTILVDCIINFVVSVNLMPCSHVFRHYILYR